MRRGGELLPLTWRGFFVVLFSSLALWRFGYETLDLLLFVVGISGLVLVTLSAIAVVGAALYLKRPIAAAVASTRRLEAGSPIRTGFEIPALDRLPLVKVGWQWIEPHEVECRIRRHHRRSVEEVVARRRDRVSAVRRRFAVGDAFGLTAVVWERSDPGPLTILPHVGRLKNMPVLQPMAAAEGLPHPRGVPEGDRMEIRRYVPGDSVRNILWKTFARTRQLNVRIPEKSIDRARKTVAYLLTGPGDEAAAAAARVALEGDLLGYGWRFGADGTAEPTESLGPALEAIACSGSYRRRARGDVSPADGLAAFLEQQGTFGEMSCVVFAPAHAGEWCADALAVTRNFSGAVSFVLGTDGVSQPGPVPLWRRFLFTEEPAVGIPTEELTQLLQTFASAGRSAQVVDRTSGRTFHQHPQQGLGAVG